jgi:DNA-binding GntR family transcriptional regulator
LRIVRRIDFTKQPRIEATYLEHGRILRSIIQRRAEEAQLMLKTHIEESKAEVRKITLHTIFEARQNQNNSQPPTPASG